MSHREGAVITFERRDFLVAGILFITALVVFWFSPVSQVSDSHYSLLLSESLLKHRSFALDHYAIPHLEPQSGVRDDYVANGSMWQIEQSNGHLYYYFPPGSSILSLPYVAFANLFRISVAREDGSYDPQAEVRLETGLAAILMAAFAGVLFFTARSMLILHWAVIVTLAATFGSQIWSTTSRALWSQTWETLLVSLVILILVRRECGKHPLNPIVLATLLAWIYFVRPGGIVVILAVSLYVFLWHRETRIKFLITGGIWLALFLVYSWIHFGQVIPNYYKPTRLRLDLFPVALLGNLISPARGLFIYVPILLFVSYLLVSYRSYLKHTKLVALALLVIVSHLVLVSSFANRWGDWWGGASYGPRYTADLVPWFSLLAIIAVRAMLTWRREQNRRSTTNLRLQLATGALLLVLSIFINARGALSSETWKWTQPISDRQMRALLWDWRHPQFLAGLQTPAPLAEVPLLELNSRIDFSSADAEKYLWYGWSGPEQGFRWTDGKQSTITFSVDQSSDLLLQIKAATFVVPDRLRTQTVSISLNNHLLETREIDAPQVFTVALQKELLSKRNVLVFDLPNATSPRALGLGKDDRTLGLRVEWMELQRAEKK